MQTQYVRCDVCVYALLTSLAKLTAGPTWRKTPWRRSDLHPDPHQGAPRPVYPGQLAAVRFSPPRRLPRGPPGRTQRLGGSGPPPRPGGRDRSGGPQGAATGGAVDGEAGVGVRRPATRRAGQGLMATAREEVLALVSEALRGIPVTETAEDVPLVSQDRAPDDGGPEQRARRFAERVAGDRARVRRVAAADLPAAVAE